MLSHSNVLKLVGVQEGVEKRESFAVSEWIVDQIGKKHANRLELVCDFASLTAPSAKM